MIEQRFFCGTGRRKTSVAQVRLFPGKGPIIVNGEPLEEYFPNPHLRKILLGPLTATETLDKFNATVKLSGGGITGQVGAVRHGLARALVAWDEGLRALLRKQGFLTRDPRMKERKKYGLKRARKAPQYTKR